MYLWFKLIALFQSLPEYSKGQVVFFCLLTTFLSPVLVLLFAIGSFVIDVSFSFAIFECC